VSARELLEKFKVENAQVEAPEAPSARDLLRKMKTGESAVPPPAEPGSARDLFTQFKAENIRTGYVDAESAPPPVFRVGPTGIPLPGAVVDADDGGPISSTLEFLFPRRTDVAARARGAREQLGKLTPGQEERLTGAVEGSKTLSGSDFLDSVAEGLSASTLPYARAGVRAAVLSLQDLGEDPAQQKSFREYYDYLRDVQFQARDKLRERSPWQAAGGEITGTLLGAGKILKVVGAAGKVLKLSAPVSTLGKIAVGAVSTAAWNVGELTADLTRGEVGKAFVESRGLLLLGGVGGAVGSYLTSKSAGKVKAIAPTVENSQNEVVQTRLRVYEGDLNKVKIKPGKKAKQVQDAISGLREATDEETVAALQRMATVMPEDGFKLTVLNSIDEVAELAGNPKAGMAAMEEFVKGPLRETNDKIFAALISDTPLTPSAVKKLGQETVDASMSELFRRLRVGGMEEFADRYPTLAKTAAVEATALGVPASHVLTSRFLVNESVFFARGLQPQAPKFGTTAARTIIREQTVRGAGKDALRGLYDQQVIRFEAGVSRVKGVRGAAENTAKTMGTAMLDGRSVALAADHKNQTLLTVTVDNLSAAMKAHKGDVGVFEPVRTKIKSLINKLPEGSIVRKPSELVRQLELPIPARATWMSTLTPSEREVIEMYQQLQKGQLKYANAIGAVIPDFEALTGKGYVHMVVKDTPELVVSFKKVKEKLFGRGTDLSNSPEFAEGVESYLKSRAEKQAAYRTAVKDKMSKKKIAALREAMSRPSNEVDDYLIGLENVGGRKIKSVEDALQFAAHMDNPWTDVGRSLTANARAANERVSGYMPDFMREHDIIKILARWDNNTYRYARMREPLADLQT